jgi:hypothetical protein
MATARPFKYRAMIRQHYLFLKTHHAFSTSKHEFRGSTTSTEGHLSFPPEDGDRSILRNGVGFGLMRHKLTKILVTSVTIHYHQNHFKLTKHTQSVTWIYRIRHRPKEGVPILNNLNDPLQTIGSITFWYCLLGPAFPDLLCASNSWNEYPVAKNNKFRRVRPTVSFLSRAGISLLPYHTAASSALVCRTIQWTRRYAHVNTLACQECQSP